MSHGDLHSFVQDLCQRLSPSAQAGLNDGQLLERWLTGRDEAAFELLLRRHGPLVLGLCRRLLRHGVSVRCTRTSTPSATSASPIASRPEMTYSV